MLLELFATDQVDFACVDFIRSPAWLMQPEFLNVSLWGCILAFKQRMHQMCTTLLRQAEW